MAELVTMESIVTIVHAEQDTQVQTVNIKSTNVTRIHAKMEQLALNITTNMNVIVHTDIKESNVKTISIGVIRVPAKMEQLVSKRRTNSDVNVHKDGQEKCAMLRGFRVVMQQHVKELM
jgi:hypothetical protein